MTRFVQVGRDWVNLAVVSVIRDRGETSVGYRTYQFEDSDGRIIASGICHEASNPKNWGTEIIPAARGASVTIINITLPADGSDPSGDDIFVWRCPIAAWRVSGESADFILADDPCGGSVFLDAPGGGYIQPWNAFHQTIEDAVATSIVDERARRSREAIAAAKRPAKADVEDGA